MAKNTCPHCGKVMDLIRTPLDSSWGGEIHYVCFNNECTYYVKSWDTLEQQGIENTGYRCRMDPRGASGALAVWSDDALRDLIVSETAEETKTLDLFSAEDFIRDDDTPDSEYRQADVTLDRVARETIEATYEELVPKGADILDLMAGPDSHISPGLEPASVTGVGTRQDELDSNRALTQRVMHDVNADPTLPFDDGQFDRVLLCNAIQYVKHPVELFSEAARVLKPNGTLIVVFSNRVLPQRATHIWKHTSEDQRVDLVKTYFSANEKYFPVRHVESTGKPRPEDDELYSLGIPSDPVYVLWAEAIK